MDLCLFCSDSVVLNLLVVGLRVLIRFAGLLLAFALFDFFSCVGFVICSLSVALLLGVKLLVFALLALVFLFAFTWYYCWVCYAAGFDFLLLG